MGSWLSVNQECRSRCGEYRSRVCWFKNGASDEILRFDNQIKQKIFHSFCHSVYKPANNSRSSDKCPVNFSFWPEKAWPDRTLWPCMTICSLQVQNFLLVCEETKGNLKDPILISHLSGSDTFDLKISRRHWRGRVLWTERASLESFVHKKYQKCVQMCQPITLSKILFLHTVSNLFVWPD